MKKRVSAVIIAMAVTIMSVAGSFAQESSNVAIKINGALADMKDAPAYVNENGRTMVSARFVSEALGFNVGWDGETQKVTVSKGSDSVELRIGKSEVFRNGKAQTLDTMPALRNNRTMVPLRFVSEALGAEVKWDGGARTVLIIVPGMPQATVKDVSELPTVKTSSIVSGSFTAVDTVKVATVNDLPIDAGHLVYNGLTKDSTYFIMPVEMDSGRTSVDMFIIQKDGQIRGRNSTVDRDGNARFRITSGGDTAFGLSSNSYQLSDVAYFAVRYSSSTTPYNASFILIENPFK